MLSSIWVINFAVLNERAPPTGCFASAETPHLRSDFIFANLFHCFRTQVLVTLRVDHLVTGPPRVAISMLGTGAFPLAIMISFTPLRQRVGDVTARTIVITTREPAKDSAPVDAAE